MSEINFRYYVNARTMALKVGFIETKEEYVLYSSAIYLAMMWGKNAK